MQTTDDHIPVNPSFFLRYTGIEDILGPLLNKYINITDKIELNFKSPVIENVAHKLFKIFEFFKEVGVLEIRKFKNRNEAIDPFSLGILVSLKKCLF